jgi:hypothetical protein
MKTTKIMLAGIGVFMLTWVLVSMLVSYLIEIDFRAAMNGSFVFMIIGGWIPSVFVGIDLSEKLQ